jgi:16S rRNA (uracil1498-N3)-methyltransferase
MSRARRRFLVEEGQLREGRAALTGAQFHHAANVLRLKAGDDVSLFTRSGAEYKARIEAVRSGSMILEVVSGSRSSAQGRFELTVIQGLVRGPAMDLIVQKCAELGAARLVAAEMMRSTARLPAKQHTGWRAKQQRWQKIADRAAEQCGAPRPMQVSIARDLEQAVREHEPQALVALHEQESGAGLRQVLKRLRGARSLALLIGPEGGLDPREVEMLDKLSAQFASLGPRILRAETAALAACSIVMYECGALDTG